MFQDVSGGVSAAALVELAKDPEKFETLQKDVDQRLAEIKSAEEALKAEQAAFKKQRQDANTQLRSQRKELEAQALAVKGREDAIDELTKKAEAAHAKGEEHRQHWSKRAENVKALEEEWEAKLRKLHKALEAVEA